MKKRYLSYRDVCTHPPEAQKTEVLETCVNCDTTVVVCHWCGKQLSEPKTDC